MKEKREIVYIDETVFLARQQYKLEAWSHKDQQIQITLPSSSTRNITVIAAISNRGLVHY